MGTGGDRPQALLIAGPTASGKSALAARLAEQVGGIVVNADSMQVYADLAILTARPGVDETARAPHTLYGTVDAAEAYSVNRWLADVARVIATSDALPVITGGTGLYFRALLNGLSAIPAVPEDVRAEIRAFANGRPAPELHAILAQRDPATAARLRPTDPQRIVRALEVHAATGGSLAEYQSRREAPLLDASRCRGVVLTIDRGELHRRLDERFDAMMVAGALAEVGILGRRGLAPSVPAMRALGVPPLLACLRGELSVSAASSAAKADTRRYVRRQETFFRHQLPSFRPASADEAERSLLSALSTHS